MALEYTMFARTFTQARKFRAVCPSFLTLVAMFVSANCNGGNRYAFNKVQGLFLPANYKPPTSRMAWGVQS